MGPTKSFSFQLDNLCHVFFYFLLKGYYIKIKKRSSVASKVTIQGKDSNITTRNKKEKLLRFMCLFGVHIFWEFHVQGISMFLFYLLLPERQLYHMPHVVYVKPSSKKQGVSIRW